LSIQQLAKLLDYSKRLTKAIDCVATTHAFVPTANTVVVPSHGVGNLGRLRILPSFGQSHRWRMTIVYM
jgi:hypothetical protein